MADAVRKAVELKDYLPEIDTFLTDVIAPLAEKTIGKNYLDTYLNHIRKYLCKEDDGKDDAKRHITRFIQDVGIKYNETKKSVDLKYYRDEIDCLMTKAINPLAEKIISEKVSWIFRSLVTSEARKYLANMQKYMYEDDDGSDETKKKLALFLQSIGEKYNSAK